MMPLPQPDTAEYRELCAFVAGVREAPENERSQSAAIMLDWAEERGWGWSEVCELVALPPAPPERQDPRFVLIDEPHDAIADDSLLAVLVAWCERCGDERAKLARSFVVEFIRRGNAGIWLTVQRDTDGNIRSTFTGQSETHVRLDRKRRILSLLPEVRIERTVRGTQFDMVEGGHVILREHGNIVFDSRYAPAKNHDFSWRPREHDWVVTYTVSLMAITAHEPWPQW